MFVFLLLLQLPKTIYTLYEGDKVFRIAISSDTQARNVAEFIRQTQNTLDYWSTELHAGGHVDVRVPRDYLSRLSDPLLEGTRLSVKIGNVEQFLREQEQQHGRRGKRATGDQDEQGRRHYKYSTYNSAAATQRELYRLASVYDNMTRLISVGTTFHNRPIIVMEVTGTNRTAAVVPLVWIDAGLHAREWITVASCMVLIKNLLEGYGTDPKITQVMDRVKFAIQPLANPDGYAYSWNTERLWRKNRSPTNIAWCRGVDLNRNFDVNWGGAGASDMSCSEVYAGANPFSENESQAMARYLASVRHKLMGYFSLHSYGQMWLTPLSYTRKRVSDRNIHMQVAQIATQSIKEASGVGYTYGPATALMYVTSGDSSDWVYTKLNCSHTYGIELGDNGRYGFILPQSYILPTGRDVLTGILAAVNVIKDDGFEVESREKRRKRRKKLLFH